MRTFFGPGVSIRRFAPSFGVGLAILAACQKQAGLHQAAQSPQAAPAAASASVTVTQLPQAAEGFYLRREAGEFKGWSAIYDMDANVWVLSNEGLVAIAITSIDAGLLLRPVKEGGSTFNLDSPHLSGQGWSLRRNGLAYVQRPDPFRARLRTHLTRPLEFAALGERSWRSQASIVEYLEILRHPERIAQSDLIRSIDPKTIEERGGNVAWITSYLRSLLVEVRDALPGDKQPPLCGYLEKLDAPARPAPGPWPAQDDEVLLDLVDFAFQSPDFLTIRDGYRVDWTHSEDERKPPGCESFLLVPDPTGNHSHPPRQTAVPAKGKLASVEYLLGTFGRHESVACGTPLDPNRTYPAGPQAVGFYILADERAEPIGAVIVGYMFGAQFLVRGRSRRDALTVLSVSSEALMQQAE